MEGREKKVRRGASYFIRGPRRGISKSRRDAIQCWGHTCSQVGGHIGTIFAVTDTVRYAGHGGHNFSRTSRGRHRERPLIGSSNENHKTSTSHRSGSCWRETGDARLARSPRFIIIRVGCGACARPSLYRSNGFIRRWSTGRTEKHLFLHLSRDQSGDLWCTCYESSGSAVHGVWIFECCRVRSNATPCRLYGTWALPMRFELMTSTVGHWQWNVHMFLKLGTICPRRTS